MTKAARSTNKVSSGRNKATVRSSRKWRLVSQWEKEETDFEKYLRIKESNEAKEKKKSNAAIKKLKKEGKVQPISGFLVYKEDVEDPWMTAKLKKVKPADRPSNDFKHGSMSKSELDDSDDDDDDDCTESLLSFKPFKSSR